MKTFTDQMGRSISLEIWPPRRIVSLVPSQTEFLADLGLEREVVGITKFCIHPQEWFQKKKRIGGTKTLDFQKIAALKPDLIIGNKEENDQSQIEALAQHFPVWMSDIFTLEDAFQMMEQVGELTGKTSAANRLVSEIRQGFAQLPIPELMRPKTAYFIWRKPYMAAGRDTFIHEMLLQVGFDNVFESSARYPEINAVQLAQAQPDLILLSSEPYPFAEKHIAELRAICPEAQICLVDGELFSWYGSRLQHTPAYFSELQKRISPLKKR